jgi:hypothetical protein
VIAKESMTDRLAIEYSVEVLDAMTKANGPLIADSSDRQSVRSVVEIPSWLNFSDCGTDGRTRPTAASKLLIQEKSDRWSRSFETCRPTAAGFRRNLSQAPDAIHMLNRGDPEQPQEPVAPTILSAFGDESLALDAERIPSGESYPGRLAHAQNDNPLTARVMVNRIWQGHFGVGTRGPRQATSGTTASHLRRTQNCSIGWPTSL